MDFVGRSEALKTLHPCQYCGACCSSFRVSFPESEVGPSGLWRVPVGLVESCGKGIFAMKGTLKTHRPSCQSLGGRVGVNVGCKIYDQRPSPCRAFEASYEDGYQKIRCDQARALHGLKPLTKLDWKKFREDQAEKLILSKNNGDVEPS